jgi:hypothetical protein
MGIRTRAPSRALCAAVEREKLSTDAGELAVVRALYWLQS